MRALGKDNLKKLIACMHWEGQPEETDNMHVCIGQGQPEEVKQEGHS